MEKIKEVRQILNNHSFPNTYVHGAINQGFIKDIDGTFDRISEEIVKLFDIAIKESFIDGMKEGGNFVINTIKDK